MKKMNKKEKKGIVLVIFSFFIGMLVGMTLLFLWIHLNKANNLSKTIKKVEDGTVSIIAHNGSLSEGEGSGFIYKKTRKKAYILTNEHVIENADVKIINSKGKEVEGKVVGQDKKLDIAVIEIEKKYAPKELKLGNSNKVEIGESVFTISTPIGENYAKTVTAGILSGKNRTVPTTTDEKREWLLNGLQFDAPINPGSSGSPLFNEHGEVIGICTMKIIKEEVEGMGFAIPINQVKPYLKQLEKGKKIDRPELGITMTEIGNRIELDEREIEVPQSITSGVVVLEVKKGSNADKKLKKGDVIIEIDHQQINETGQVKNSILNHHKNETITVKVIRNNKEKNIKITLH